MANRPTHAKQGSVLDGLGFSSGPAAVLKFKAELYQAILKVARTYSKKELQRILVEPQARLSQFCSFSITPSE